MFVICTKLENLRVELKVLQILSGLLKSAHLKVLRPSQTSLSSIICKMAPIEAFPAKSCWLCPQIHSFRQLSVDCLIATFHRGTPLLAREWVNIVRHELFSYRASIIFPAPLQLFQELADQLFWVADMRGLACSSVSPALTEVGMWVFSYVSEAVTSFFFVLSWYDLKS